MPIKMFKIISITAVLLVAFFVVLYVSGSNSEPYKVAERYVLNNEKINSEFGKITDVRLAFFGYSVNYNGASGNADLELVIHSDNKKANVYLAMKKDTGKWAIIKSRMSDGKNSYIELEPH